MAYDFGGWATRNDLRCADGRIIRKDAFKSQDGQTVPLVWNHNHEDPNNVLGLAHLENRDDGVYAYCEFNENESGKTARELVRHGDVRSLSIFANQLKQSGADVVHGLIREVSLVLAGANPGAFIDDVLEHSNNADNGVILGFDENIMLFSHADDKKEEAKAEEDSDDNKKSGEKEETIQDILDTMTDKQRDAMLYVLAQLVEEEEADDEETKNKKDDSEEGGNTEMKHNVFDNEQRAEQNTLSHAAQGEILGMAKQSNVGTLRNALKQYASDNALKHADASGFESDIVDYLFPDYQEVRPGAPELVTYDQGWVTRVINKVHKSPISRVRTSQVDIRNIDAIRAQGYVKGSEKTLAGNFSLIRRTTDPQTIYVKTALNRDDINDITDFDYVAYLYNIDRIQLNEELATAIMIGDSREDSDAGKIFPEHIRPIWTDNDLYTIHTDIDFEAAKTELQGTNTSANFGDNYVYAEAIIEAVLHAREDCKGTGTPDFYCTPALLNTMLLARDLNGRRIYNTKAEIASALNVGDIFTVEQFAGKTRTTSDNATKKLLGIVVNLDDYNVGATKGGEISHFTQFDLDFNQEKSLLETRCSGALTRVYSAIAIEEDVTSAG